MPLQSRGILISLSALLITLGVAYSNSLTVHQLNPIGEPISLATASWNQSGDEIWLANTFITGLHRGPIAETSWVERSAGVTTRSVYLVASLGNYFNLYQESGSSSLVDLFNSIHSPDYTYLQPHQAGLTNSRTTLLLIIEASNGQIYPFSSLFLKNVEDSGTFNSSLFEITQKRNFVKVLDNVSK